MRGGSGWVYWGIWGRVGFEDRGQCVMPRARTEVLADVAAPALANDGELAAQVAAVLQLLLQNARLVHLCLRSNAQRATRTIRFERGGGGGGGFAGEVQQAWSRNFDPSTRGGLHRWAPSPRRRRHKRHQHLNSSVVQLLWFECDSTLSKRSLYFLCSCLLLPGFAAPRRSRLGTFPLVRLPRTRSLKPSAA